MQTLIKRVVPLIDTCTKVSGFSINNIMLKMLFGLILICLIFVILSGSLFHLTYDDQFYQTFKLDTNHCFTFRKLDRLKVQKLHFFANFSKTNYTCIILC